jgi:chromosome segregation ATPase
MADSIIEQIQKSKSLVAKLRKVISDMEADGVDADEAKRIEQNKDQIAQLLAELTKLEQQLEADKKEWNGRAGDLKTVRDQLQTLKDWGTFDLAAIESELAAADAFATSEDYRAATTRLGEVKTALAKPYEEYTKQLAAKESRRPRRRSPRRCSSGPPRPSAASALRRRPERSRAASTAATRASSKR